MNHAIKESIIITIDGRELTYSSNDGMITDWAKKKGIEFETHCGQGFCGACVKKVKPSDDSETSDLVHTSDDAIAYIGDDEIVCCQSTPLQNITLTSR